MAPGVGGGTQRRYVRAGHGDAQTHQGDVLGLGAAPRLVQNDPLDRTCTVNVREGQPHAAPGLAAGGADDVCAGDEDVLGDQETGPAHLIVLSDDLGHGAERVVHRLLLRRQVPALP